MIERVIDAELTIEGNWDQTASNYFDEEGDGDEYAEDEHSTEAPQMQSASTSAIHQWDGDERHSHHNSTRT